MNRAGRIKEITKCLVVCNKKLMDFSKNISNSSNNVRDLQFWELTRIPLNQETKNKRKIIRKENRSYFLKIKELCQGRNK